MNQQETKTINNTSTITYPSGNTHLLAAHMGIVLHIRVSEDGGVEDVHIDSDPVEFEAFEMLRVKALQGRVEGLAHTHYPPIRVTHTLEERRIKLKKMTPVEEIVTIQFK